ncbi:RrF2 family transcriptional regulator [Cetobacterium somerae]|uniref:RrF2 family transcriptional regulator n=1 Tax=Cetobacterium somerae TaxID=188913 RepID=UPI003892B3AA
MRFNKETDYAIRMTIFCAKNKSKLLLSINIVKECRVPENLGKAILTKLTSNNILESVKGKNGGIRYVHGPKEISLLDIIEKFEKIEINSCVSNSSICTYKNGECVVREEMGNIKNILENHLKNIFIEDLIDNRY